MWSQITPLDESKKAGTIALKLPDKAKDLALEMDTEVLAKGKTDANGVTKTGVECLLVEMDKLNYQTIRLQKYRFS